MDFIFVTVVALSQSANVKDGRSLLQHNRRESSSGVIIVADKNDFIFACLKWDL
jgi:hypothetical protein